MQSRLCAAASVRGVICSLVCVRGRAGCSLICDSVMHGVASSTRWWGLIGYLSRKWASASGRHSYGASIHIHVGEGHEGSSRVCVMSSSMIRKGAFAWKVLVVDDFAQGMGVS